jgi:hypothetical protein
VVVVVVVAAVKTTYKGQITGGFVPIFTRSNLKLYMCGFCGCLLRNVTIICNLGTIFIAVEPKNENQFISSISIQKSNNRQHWSRDFKCFSGQSLKKVETIKILFFKIAKIALQVYLHDVPNNNILNYYEIYSLFVSFYSLTWTIENTRSSTLKFCFVFVLKYKQVLIAKIIFLKFQNDFLKRWPILIGDNNT